MGKLMPKEVKEVSELDAAAYCTLVHAPRLLELDTEFSWNTDMLIDYFSG